MLFSNGVRCIAITYDVVADTLAGFTSRYGVPFHIVTNRRLNLVSQAIKKVCSDFGIKHVTTTPYHGAGNGQIERQNRTLSNAFSLIANENKSDRNSKVKFPLLPI